MPRKRYDKIYIPKVISVRDIAAARAAKAAARMKATQPVLPLEETNQATNNESISEPVLPKSEKKKEN